MQGSSSPVTLRPYDASHRPACLRVFDSNVPRYFRAEERSAFATFLDELPGPYLVLVEADHALVGCGGYALRPEDGVVDLCWGMIRQDRHGSGLGRALAEARLDAIVKEARAKAVALNTSQHTVPFYERLGFRTIKVVKDGYAPGLDRCDMWIDLSRPDSRGVGFSS